MFFITVVRETRNMKEIEGNKERTRKILNRIKFYNKAYNLHYEADDLFNEFVERMSKKTYIEKPDITYDNYIFSYLKYFMLEKMKEEYTKNTKEVLKFDNREGYKYTLPEHAYGDKSRDKDYDVAIEKMGLEELKEEYFRWKKIMGESFFKYMVAKYMSIFESNPLSDKDIAMKHKISMATISKGKSRLKEHTSDYMEWMDSIQKIGFTLLEFIEMCEKKEKVNLRDLDIEIVIENLNTI